MGGGRSPVDGPAVSGSPGPDERAERERRAIIRAAHRLIGRDGRTATPIEDILRAAGVNRRVFYRHFPSKDALVLTMQRESADAVLAALRSAVAGAPDGRGAVLAWIEEYLAIGWDERGAREGRTFVTPEAGLVTGIADALEDTYAADRRLLAEALARGRADGTVPAARPDRDAFAIHAVVLRCLEMRAHGRLDVPYATVLAHIVDLFVPPAPVSAATAAD